MTVYNNNNSGMYGSGDVVVDSTNLNAERAEAAALAAEVSKTAAELAEVNAETAETGALAAEAEAEAAEAVALAQAALATTAASNAATSETNAATSETNASSSASAAASSASAASSSATAASNSETAAAASASAAASSATNSANSATASATSASESASSASAAATSETNAANSASAASSSASAAATSASNAATSESNASASAAAAALSYDNFDDRYLGAKAVAPTLDNDGNTLLVGALYFDTVENLMKVWTGSAWISSSVDPSTVTYENLSANGDVGTGATQVAQGSHLHTGVYEPADSTILKDADIGSTVQAYDVDTVKKDVVTVFTAGVGCDPVSHGSISSLAPNFNLENIQLSNVSGNFTLNAPINRRAQIMHIFLYNTAAYTFTANAIYNVIGTWDATSGAYNYLTLVSYGTTGQIALYIAQES